MGRTRCEKRGKLTLKEAQWYPGNMARAINHLRQDLRIVDLAVELLDARIPYSSRNPIFAELLKDKKHLVLLHKADRAEDSETAKWLLFFKNQNITAMPFSVHHKSYLNQLLRFLKEQENNLRPTRIKRPLRMIIVGIPNVGKSTMINFFVNKAVTRTGNQPGITKGRQWIRINPGLELLDTPGVLWPRIDENSAWPLAVVGAIPPSRIDLESIALWLIDYYLDNIKAGILSNRYQLTTVNSAEEIFEQIAKTQGCLQAEGKPESNRTAALLLRDFQAGLLGRVTLEKSPL
jgi:ribosome biogenesis GTPase A